MKKRIEYIIAFLIFSFIFLNYLARFEGAATGYWDTYITAPAVFITGQSVDFTSKDGESLYRYSLPGSLPENLVDMETYGIISKDQRIGGGIMFAPWFLFFGLFGFRLLFAITGLLTALFTFLTVRLFSEKFYVCIFSAVAITLNSYLLSLSKLNPNILGMLLISILLYLILSKKCSWFIIGLVFGVLGGVRNIGILFLPAAIYGLFASPGKKTRNTLLFVFGALITIAPILYWNHFAFGDILMHPSQFGELEGFRPVFEHRFLFWKFDFNGMFNYPFHDKIVRTPYFCLPTFLILPLTLISSFGVILSVLVFTGTVNLFKKHRQVFIFLVLWFLPMYLIFSVQENWSELKTTFVLLFLNPLIIFMSFGVWWLFEKKFIRKNIVKTALLTILFILVIKLGSHADFAVDERWYVRFPRAAGKNKMSYIGDDLRTEPESPEMLERQKKELTRANLLPKVDVQKVDLASALNAAKQEFGQKNITVVDYWKYIYEK
ncbi:hypothetical protein ACFL3J_01145 [Candidatus Omnitrophota bacterium]